MKFDTLEQEFKYYHNLLEWKFIFTAIKGYTPSDHKNMSAIIDSIIIGVTTGLSTVEATNKFENIKQLINNEKFKNFLFKITKKVQSSGELTIRNLRSFNSLRIALVFSEVYKILEKNGIEEPQAIAEKILMPSIVMISEDEAIENKEELKLKWANLLVNAARGNFIHPKYPYFLNNLSNLEAKILNDLYNQKDKSFLGIKQLSESYNKSESEIRVATENLISENLCADMFQNGIRRTGWIVTTELGKNFISTIT